MAALRTADDRKTDLAAAIAIFVPFCEFGKEMMKMGLLELKLKGFSKTLLAVVFKMD